MAFRRASDSSAKPSFKDVLVARTRAEIDKSDFSFVRKKNSRSGIALFMVISALTVLSLLVTEFTYVSQINKKMAYDTLNNLKALYTAKSAFKLSLLRLKAFRHVKDKIGAATSQAQSSGVNVGSLVPKKLLDKIWSFPLIYPIPTAVPGLEKTQVDEIQKFTQESAIDGDFSALIQSESSKININMILAPLIEKKKEEKKEEDKNKNNTNNDNNNNDNNSDTANNDDKDEDKKDDENEDEPFNTDAARQALFQYFEQTLRNKFERDEDFADEYSDLRLEDLMNGIYGWADIAAQDLQQFGDNPIEPKKAPFYSLTELFMIPPMDDKLYDLFASNLTATTTPGINVNSMQEPTFIALFPEVVEEERKQFFEYRDDETQDNHFKKLEDFYTFIKENFSVFAGSDSRVEDFTKELDRKNIRFTVDDTVFKIVVQAQYRQSVKVIEAWVTYLEQPQQANNQNNNQNQNQTPNPNVNTNTAQTPPLAGPGRSQVNQSSGLKVTFMRIF